MSRTLKTNITQVKAAAAGIFGKYSGEKGLNIAKGPSLHSNVSLLDVLDVVDIRLENNITVDLRVIVGENYPQMCIPREHFQLGTLPDIYVGVRLDKNLAKGEIVGFIKAENVSKLKGNKNYFIVEAGELEQNFPINISPGKERKFLAADHEKAEGLFIPFIDGNISGYLLEHLYTCAECRKKFNKIVTLELALRGVQIDSEPDQPLGDLDDAVTPLSEEFLGEGQLLPDVPFQEIKEEKIEKPEKVAEESEDILISLDDVEILQGEDDIDSLLSFFDSESEQVDEEPQEIPEKKDRGDVKVKKGDTIGYTSVIEAKSNINEDEDFLIEEVPSAEVIRQEDLMHIFDTEISELQDITSQSKKGNKFILSSLLKDKSILAFTAAITLATTVMFLYLGLINNQVRMANNSQNAQKSNDNNNSQQIKIKREREPIKSYTREIVKVIKPEMEKENEALKSGEKLASDIKKKIVLPEPERVEVKDISWELPASVAQDPQVREYFIALGQQLKSRLTDNLNVSGLDNKNLDLTIDAEINARGELITSKVTYTSGLEQVDNICLTGLNNAINKNKLSGLSIRQDKIKFSLQIRI